ncbi:hypothetical protein [Pedosphaera parvula]|uniref:Uncharacterized protein n=1 Tax=Pedosphaera parvula (strain Ellin514) TaxID=320771 RepID=B9XDH2_PEDPL|nr:hypothetical protein [Pedosphaera parvula]EEF62118.1 hypothetical protein Cflav_PD6393 [Pedosphaera parvula Ellin514]
MVFLHRIAPAFCVVLLTVQLRGEDIKPDFNKLAPVALYPSLMETARTNNIPIEGMDTPDNTDNLNPGDSLTALITLFEKGGHKTQMLLYVEVAAPTAEEQARKPGPPTVCYVGAGDKMEFTNGLTPVNLRLLGPFAETTGRSKPPKFQDKKAHITLNKGFLALGLDQAGTATCRIKENHVHGNFLMSGRPFTEAQVAEGKKAMTALQLSLPEQRAIAGADFALMSYVQLVQATPGLDTLFEKVVKLPSIWSIASHLGVDVNLKIESQYVTTMDASKWNLTPQTPCYAYPLALQLNDQPALITTLVVAPPRPPLLGCAGIVGLLAEKSGDKETYLTLRIISAHKKLSPIR